MEKHAGIEIQTKDADAPEQSKNTMSLFIFLFQSVVLAALFPIVVRCSGRDVLIAVWRLSLLFCSYFYSAVCVLSAATRKRKVCLLVLLTYAALLALVVDVILSRAAGAVIMYLASVWIAGAFGQTIAEYRASEKAADNTQVAQEKLARELGSIILLALVYSASAMPLCMLVMDYSFEYIVLMTVVVLILDPTAMHIVHLRHRPSEKAAPSSKEARGKLAGESGLIIFIALVFSACGLCPMCIILAAPRGALLLSPLQEDLVAYMTMGLCSCVPVFIICTLKPFPRGGGDIVIVLGVECDTPKVLSCLYISSFMLFTPNFFLASEVGAVLVLGLAVFFGYCNGIHPCFLLRSRPKMWQLPAHDVKKKQAGGKNKEQTSSDSITTLLGSDPEIA